MNSIRGISSDADVQTLRRLFRSAMSEGLPVDVSSLSSLGVEELCGSAESKIAELQSLVTQSKSGLLLIPRFRTRISRLRGRLLHLTTLGLFPSNITTSNYKELHDLLDRIEQSITSLEMSVLEHVMNAVSDCIAETQSVSCVLFTFFV
jgi:hypothetical protein